MPARFRKGFSRHAQTGLATRDDLTTLATKDELRAAIASLATREEMRAATAPLATREEMHAAIAAATKMVDFMVVSSV